MKRIPRFIVVFLSCPISLLFILEITKQIGSNNTEKN